MANRTIQFHGQGYGSAPVNIVATFDGNQVYSGTVPTVVGPYDPNTEEILFTTTVSTDFTGNVPVSITASGGALMFTQVTVNYGSAVPNPVYNADQYATVTNVNAPRADKVAIWTALAVPPLTSEEQAFLLNGPWQDIQPTLTAHNLESDVNNDTTTFVSPMNGAGDSRSNVIINGVPQSPPPVGAGDFSWFVPVDGNITYTQIIYAANPTVM